MPKLEQYLLCSSLIAVFAAILYISVLYTITPAQTANQLGLTVTSSQIVKTWNFNETTEGWKGYNNAQVQANNGYLNVKLGLFPANNNIQNREVQAHLPLPLKYLTFKLAIQKAQVAYPNSAVTDSEAYFTFYVYYKKAGNDSWFGPRTLYGKVSPYFKEYAVKIPILSPLTITDLKVAFIKGIAFADTVQFDAIRIINQSQPAPTGYLLSPKPTYSWLSPTPYKLTPTPYLTKYPILSCYAPPPCYYGVKDPSGNMYYCLPAYEGQWCIVNR